MQPEFPPNFDLKACWHEPMDAALPCGMLKLGQRCGNDSFDVIVSERNQFHRLPFCDSCRREWSLTLSGAEVTAYWREKQREWGVR